MGVTPDIDNNKIVLSAIFMIDDGSLLNVLLGNVVEGVIVQNRTMIMISYAKEEEQELTFCCIVLSVSLLRFGNLNFM